MAGKKYRNAALKVDRFHEYDLVDAVERVKEITEAKFDALVTMDKSIEYQQNFSGIKLGIIIVSARSNRRQDVAPAVPEINKILKTMQAGVVIHVAA